MEKQKSVYFFFFLAFSFIPHLGIVFDLHLWLHLCWIFYKIKALPESLISSSDATFTLISWLSKLFFANGLPSLSLSCPGRSGAVAAPDVPSWQNGPVKPGWTWFWAWEEGLGLSASSTLGSSFRWNGDLSISLWLAAMTKNRHEGQGENWEEKEVKKIIG